MRHSELWYPAQRGSEVAQLIAVRRGKPKAVIAALDTAKNRAASMAGTVEDWEIERPPAARQAYPVPDTGMRLKPGQKLGDAYTAASLPVVRRRLSQARVRGHCRVLSKSRCRSEEVGARCTWHVCGRPSSRNNSRPLPIDLLAEYSGSEPLFVRAAIFHLMRITVDGGFGVSQW
jgi:hypothetical protein